MMMMMILMVSHFRFEIYIKRGHCEVEFYVAMELIGIWLYGNLLIGDPRTAVGALGRELPPGSYLRNVL